MLNDSTKNRFQKQVESGMQRFLRGKEIAGLPAPIQTVEKIGENRKFTDVRGNVLVLKPGQAKAAFNKALAVHQRIEALKTVRQTKGKYTATVMLGGKHKGVKQTYQNKASAMAAVNQRYSLAFSSGSTRPIGKLKQ